MQSTEYTPQLENIKIVKHLYSTKLSKVWLVEHSDELCILKGKEIKNIVESDYVQLKRERQFLDSNNNTKFPKFKKAFKDENYLYMLLNFKEGIPLSSLILNNVFKFTIFNNFEEFIYKKELYLSLVAQAVELVDLLHKELVIYRDLKMNNIIINNNLQLALVDFGFNKKLEDGFTTTVCGTYHIMAPEVLENKFGGNNSYTFSSDIYSLGVFMYELFKGSPPFEYVYDFSPENLQAYLEKIKKGIDSSYFINFMEAIIDEPEIHNFLQDISDLIQACMAVDPTKRPKIIDIKNHSVFGNNFEKYLKTDISKSNQYIGIIVDYIEFNGDFVKDYEKIEDDTFEKFF
jgi:serine/threonine protein kinase